MKITNKILEKFLKIANDYGEFVFGDKKQIKQQLEICLNSQGYWSGTYYRFYYNDNIKDFYLESRF